MLGSCPLLSCPLCLSTPAKPTDGAKHEKKRPKLLPAAEVFSIFPSTAELDKYNALVQNILSFQCGSCHRRKSLLVPADKDAARLKLLEKLASPAMVDALIDHTLHGLDTGDICLEDCYQTIVHEYVPTMQSVSGPANEIEVAETFTLIMQCVTEGERRANLQLRYLRDRPFIETSCCKRKHCFTCRSRDWHTSKSCAENSNSFFDGRILPCPQCGIQLTKGDGCDHITCVCQRSFSWSTELKGYEENEQFRQAFPANTSYHCAALLCRRVEGNERLAASWRSKHQLETNSCLLQIVADQYKNCTPQWCAIFEDGRAINEPPIYREISNLYRTANKDEVDRCAVQNAVAVKSLFDSLFPSDEEKALAVDMNKDSKCQTAMMARTASLSVADRSKVQRSAELWVQHSGSAAISRQVKLQYSSKTADQFLCLYGHMVPGSLSETPGELVTYTSVNKFQPYKCDRQLLLREVDTIVTRIGRMGGCYPAALAPLTSTRSVVRFRLLSVEKSGNSLSFGLCHHSFPHNGSSGIGVTKGSYGLMEHRDAYANSVVVKVNISLNLI
jgi:hypothetical protein